MAPNADATPSHGPSSDWDSKNFIERSAWRITRWHVASPCISFCSVFSFIIALVIAAAVAPTGLGNSEEVDHTWDVTTSKFVQRYDILENLNDRTDLLTSSENIPTRTVALTGISMILVYETKDGSDVFTPAHLQRICRAEHRWFGDDSYSSFCPLEANTTIYPSATCVAPQMSVAAMFYPYSDVSSGACPLLADSTVAAVRGAIYSALTTTQGLYQYGFFAGADFQSKGYTRRTRSLLQVGGPLAGYSVTTDAATNEDQEAEYELYFSSVQDAWIDDLDMEPGFMQSIYRDDTSLGGGLDFMWFGSVLNGGVFDDLINTDLIMVIFSIAFVWIWINIHIESAFLASVGMLQIVLSLPFSRFFYSVVGGITYFSTLQSLAIFLVLGIGADDVFVLVDGWRQSEHDLPRHPGEDERDWIHRRLLSSYDRTMQAVFNTSFTTAMAFISTAISPIMPISTFGIYAALCIVANFFFVITLTPPAVMIHHDYFGGFGRKGWCWVNVWPCCAVLCPLPASAVDLDAAVPPPKEAELVSFKPKAMPGKGAAAAAAATPSRSPISPASAGDSPARGPEAASLELDASSGLLARTLVTAYEHRAPAGWGRLAGVKVVALACVGASLGLAAFMGSQAATLSLPVEQEQWFPDDHMLQRFIFSQEDFLLSDSSNYDTTSLVWGAKKHLRRPDFDPYNPDVKRGDATLDGAFDPADPAAFRAITDTCAALAAKDCSAAGCAPLGKLVQTGTVVCALQEFEDWHVATHGVSATTLGAGSAVFYDRLLWFRSNTVPAAFPTRNWGELIGVIDGEVRYIVVTGLMTMDMRAPNGIKEDVLPVLDAVVGEADKPAAAAEVFHTARVWVWYATNGALLSGMVTGLAIAFPVAFCTLIFATHNVLIAAFAILTIAMIVSSVLGAAALEGWGLGVAESIAAVIVVGFSVDYTIHLGHMYDHAGRHEGWESREERARYAILKMGSTVFAGAVTTMGSGSFMFACQLTFFTKMAFLICVTIAFSLLYSLIFFMPLLYLAGPSGTSGHITHFAPKFFTRGDTE